MPHITMKNLEISVVQKLSKELTPSLSELIGCPADWITFTHLSSTTFMEGEKAEKTAFVHLDWFPRPPEKQSATVKMITNGVLATGIDEVIFTVHLLDGDQYYENGELR